MKKRILAFILCLSMICGMIPVSTYAVSDEEGQSVVCEECGETEGHLKTCSKYEPVCTCTPVDGVHQEGCDFYVEPQTQKCEYCGVELTEGAEHAQNCQTRCTCTPVDGVHQSGCVLAPKEENTGIKVGDTIWIKSGANVYKNLGDTEGYSIGLIYKITIKSIEQNGDEVWYQYDYADLSAILGNIFLNGYKYIKAVDTSVDKPVTDEYACNCGENAPENLAQHADTCPRKQYIKTLFDGKTAEEIYANWDNYDETTQTDILDMLQVYDSSKYDALNMLIRDKDYKGGLDVPYVQYKGTAANGISVIISAPEGSFRGRTTVSITDANVTVSEVVSVINDNILGIASVDISFGGVQPAGDVLVHMSIPEDKIPDGTNKIYIVHMGSSGPEVVGEKYVDTSDSSQTVSFSTNGFSNYATVFADAQYDAQKMSSFLQGNDRYEIAEFNVDLFDYDPTELNKVLKKVTSDNNGFYFVSYDDGMTSNNGINNSASTYAKQGIVEDTLTNGLPVFKYLNGDNAGINTGKILFSDTEAYTGKTIYKDIPFEFIYDKETGYYEYKSSANHAQLNAEGNKVELYADTLSVENTNVATPNLNTASDTNDFVDISQSTNSFKATVKNTNGDGRIDPYVVFSVDKVAASDVGNIYVKAKVPASVGSNVLQLFFITDQDNKWTEDKSFGRDGTIPYTANGDWIEFEVSTSGNDLWKDQITGIRIDLLDSKYTTTMDVNGSYDIEIDRIVLGRGNYNQYSTYGGFYPFSEIQDSYPGNGETFNYDTWLNQFTNDNKTLNVGTRSIFNPSPADSKTRNAELAFATAMEFDFYLPVDQSADNPLTYYFSGDDDLWVFVDDQLVLDIGGGHGAISGTIDFTGKTWSVTNAVSVTSYDKGADSAAEAKSGSVSEALCEPGKHTMKIFYMERCGSVSNCFMKFNLPRTPQGSVVVSKETVEKNSANNDVLKATEFEFKIQVQNMGAGGDGNKHPYANQAFYVVDSDGNSVSKTTDDKGKFTLKSDESAYFQIDENYDVTITETRKEIADHEYISTTINGVSGFTSTQLTVKGQEKRFAFVNTYERLYGDLKIIKTGISTVDHNSAESQSTMYQISGTSNKGDSINLTVAILANGTTTIKHIPIGNYTVTEMTDWSWRYSPKANDRQITVTGGNTAETTFENERDQQYWLSGDSYCENWWNLTDGNVEQKIKNPNLN